jgi:AcrR family transcriptional regulator
MASVPLKNMPTSKKPRSARARTKTASGTWQAEKSLLTQTQILEATMQCLIEIGYAQTTTDKIAQKAGVSRGAMTHHFKSRAAVFSAAAKYITDLRAIEYDDAIARVTAPTTGEPTLDNMRDTITFLQKYYAKPSFIALHELQRGARTDKALGEVMAPLEEALDSKISAAILNRFPVWGVVPQASELLRDLIFATLQGVAIDPVNCVKGARLQRLMELLATVAQNEFEKAYERVNNSGSPNGVAPRPRSRAPRRAAAA